MAKMKNKILRLTNFKQWFVTYENDEIKWNTNIRTYLRIHEHNNFKSPRTFYTSELSNAYWSQLTTSPVTCIQQGSADAKKNIWRLLAEVRVWNSDINDFENPDLIENLLDSGQKTE